MAVVAPVDLLAERGDLDGEIAPPGPHGAEPDALQVAAVGPPPNDPERLLGMSVGGEIQLTAERPLRQLVTDGSAHQEQPEPGGPEQLAEVGGGRMDVEERRP